VATMLGTWSHKEFHSLVQFRGYIYLLLTDKVHFSLHKCNVIWWSSHFLLVQNNMVIGVCRYFLTPAYILGY